MALWITLGVIVFIVGTIMSLQPSAKERATGHLRDEARKQALNPRLVPCPDWLINQSGEKGKGMVALYGLVSQTKLPRLDAQIINGKLNVVGAEASANTVLHGEDCCVDGALGLTIRAEFIGLYWTEKVSKNKQKQSAQSTDATQEALKNIKQYLQNTAKQVQAKRNLP